MESDAYRCSLAVRIQPAVDHARRIQHVLGLRPYRVFLVWQERDRQRDWNEVQRLELIPVRVVAMDDIDLELSSTGLQTAGRLMLRDVSPAQVDEDLLRGYVDGEPWGKDTIDREFFYEVILHDRCGTGSGMERRRFTSGTVPHRSATNYEWRMGLIDQEMARKRDGSDGSLTHRPRHELPKIVP